MAKKCYGLEIVDTGKLKFNYVMVVLQINVPFPATQAEQLTWLLFNKGKIRILEGKPESYLTKLQKTLSGLNIKNELVEC